MRKFKQMEKTKVIILLFAFFIPLNSNSQKWFQVGNGVGSIVTSIFNDTISNTLYIGGVFASPSMSIVSWNGSSFSGMGFGLTDCPPYDILRYSGNITIGGPMIPPSFNGYIYMMGFWDENLWNQMGFDPFSSFGLLIADIEIYQGDLYAAGILNMVDSSIVNNIVKWNVTDSTWGSVDNGVYLGNIGNVNTMTVFNNELYVGGRFDTAGTVNVNNIAKWNGVNWTSVGNGINDEVIELKEHKGKLYAGTWSSGLFEWNGNNWINIAQMNSRIITLYTFQDKLIIGGFFTSINGDSIKYIATWDGINFDSIGTELNDNVLTMTEYQGELIIGGYFTTAGVEIVNYIARLDMQNTSNKNKFIPNKAIKINPNPFSTSAIIKIKGQIADASFVLYDIFGREVKRIDKIETNQIKITRDNLPAGMYFYKLKSQEEIIGIGKVIIN